MKKIIGILSLGLVAVSIVSCGKNNISNTSVLDNTSVLTTTKSDNSKPLKNLPTKVDVTKIYSNDSYNDFVIDYNDFSVDILERLEKNNNNSNTSYSPLSIYSAISSMLPMLSDTAKEEVLQSLGMDIDEVEANTKILYSLSNDKYSILSNSIWFSDELDINYDTVKKIANTYYSEIFKIDFASESNLINEYIKNHTNDLLDSCGPISDDTILYILNTFYFNDAWSFDAKTNGHITRYFENTDKSYETKTLYYSNYNSFEKSYITDDYKSYYLRSKNDYKLSFVIPLGDKKVSDIYNKENIKDIIEHNYYVRSDNNIVYNTRIAFPEFSAGFDDEITNVIKDMGINEIFNADNNPFSNITTNNDVAAGSVWHRTKLNVNKDGMEGAAATSISITCAATTYGGEIQNVYDTFYVDKSFFYVIEDKMGSIVFSGVVNKIDSDN